MFWLRLRRRSDREYLDGLDSLVQVYIERYLTVSACQRGMSSSDWVSFEQACKDYGYESWLGCKQAIIRDLTQIIYAPWGSSVSVRALIRIFRDRPINLPLQFPVKNFMHVAYVYFAVAEKGMLTDEAMLNNRDDWGRLLDPKLDRDSDQFIEMIAELTARRQPDRVRELILQHGLTPLTAEEAWERSTKIMKSRLRL